MAHLVTGLAAKTCPLPSHTIPVAYTCPIPPIRVKQVFLKFQYFSAHTRMRVCVCVRARVCVHICPCIAMCRSIPVEVKGQRAELSSLKIDNKHLYRLSHLPTHPFKKLKTKSVNKMEHAYCPRYWGEQRRQEIQKLEACLSYTASSRGTPCFKTDKS